MVEFNSNGVYFNAELKCILRILRIRNKFKDGHLRWLETRDFPLTLLFACVEHMTLLFMYVRILNHLFNRN